MRTRRFEAQRSACALLSKSCAEKSAAQMCGPSWDALHESCVAPSPPSRTLHQRRQNLHAPRDETFCILVSWLPIRSSLSGRDRLQKNSRLNSMSRPCVKRNERCDRLHRAETKLRLCAFCVRLCFPARFLCRCFEGAQTTHFVHDSFGVEFAFEPFESAINGLSFANDNFRHVGDFRLNFESVNGAGNKARSGTAARQCTVSLNFEPVPGHDTMSTCTKLLDYTMLNICLWQVALKRHPDAGHPQLERNPLKPDLLPDHL